MSGALERSDSTALLLAGGLLKVEPLSHDDATESDVVSAKSKGKRSTGELHTDASGGVEDSDPDAALKFLEEQLAAVRKQLVTVREKELFFFPLIFHVSFFRTTFF
jgi:hypothetical protein